jgi:hypothetical protein
MNTKGVEAPAEGAYAPFKTLSPAKLETSYAAFETLDALLSDINERKKANHQIDPAGLILSTQLEERTKSGIGLLNPTETEFLKKCINFLKYGIKMTDKQRTFLKSVIRKAESSK